MWKSLRRPQGFTIIEMMVAVGITSVIVIAALSIVVSSNRAYTVNTQVADTQQNLRLAMELMTREIRLAGFNYNTTDPATVSVPGCAVTVGAFSKPAGLLPQDQAPAGPDAGPDQVSLVVPVMNTSPWTLSGAAGGTPPNPVVPFNAINLSASAIAAMQAQGLAVGSTISIGGAESRTVTQVNPTQIQFGAANFVNAQFPAGTPVYLLQCVNYRIVQNTPATCGSNMPCLVRNNVPLVDGVEDLQVTYACDGCNTGGGNPPLPNGVIDNQDGSSSGGFPTFTQGDFISNVTWAVTPFTPDKIKLVQLSLVVRQSLQERGLSETGAIAANTTGPIIVGDHNPSTDAGYNAASYQQSRRRVLTRTIQPRNL
jgi:type IV pilus assembly protein PilW